MPVITVTKENFEQEVVKAGQPVLVDFWAPWCSPCRAIAPIVEQISKEKPQLKVAKVNIDEQPELASQYGVMSIPTLILMKNGEAQRASIGMRNKEAILDFIGM